MLLEKLSRFVIALLSRLMLLCICFPAPTPAPTPYVQPSFSEEQKVTASNPELDAEYGAAVSVAGDLAVVGAPKTDIRSDSDATMFSAGSLYFLHRDSSTDEWREVELRTASNAAQFSYLGCSVHMSDNGYAIAGAYGSSYPEQIGRAYIFSHTSQGKWAEVQTLLSVDDPAAHVNDRFGADVSIDGNFAMVGAPYAGIPSKYSSTQEKEKVGAVYVYQRQTDGSWGQVQKLFANDADEDQFFGHSVAISGDYAVIGAPCKPHGPSPGSVYVFKRSGNEWRQVQKLIPSDGGASDEFGHRVKVSGNFAIVGAPYHDAGTTSDAGAAYVFEFKGDSSEWIEAKKLDDPDPATRSYFGMSVDISAEGMGTAVVGKTRQNHGKGSAYVFGRNTGSWQQQAKLLANDATEGDEFGSEVAIAGDELLIAAHMEDGAERQTYFNYGSVYVFQRHWHHGE